MSEEKCRHTDISVVEYISTDEEGNEFLETHITCNLCGEIL